MIKCFDVVKDVVDEATNQFRPLWRACSGKMPVLKRKCSDIETLAMNSNAEAYNVAVDEIKMTISISFECPRMVIKGKERALEALLNQSIKTEFSVNPENGNLVVGFTFLGIWEHI